MPSSYETIHVALAQAEHSPQIETLIENSFGPERLHLTVYRLREGVPSLSRLTFIATDSLNSVHGSLQFWPCTIGTEKCEALLLGPLAIETHLRGQGYGSTLVRHGLKKARQQGHKICLVVGNPDYYSRFGFTNATSLGLSLPGPVDPKRFLALELQSGALAQVKGLVHSVEKTHPFAALS